MARLKASPRAGDTPSDRPPTLPAGTFRPKQSLGQNYLSDNNIATKITNSLEDTSEKGKGVVELGPGLGALTRLLVRSYPEMVAIEIARAPGARCPFPSTPERPSWS